MCLSPTYLLPQHEDRQYIRELQRLFRGTLTPTLPLSLVIPTPFNASLSVTSIVGSSIALSQVICMKMRKHMVPLIALVQRSEQVSKASPVASLMLYLPLVVLYSSRACVQISIPSKNITSFNITQLCIRGFWQLFLI